MCRYRPHHMNDAYMIHIYMYITCVLKSHHHDFKLSVNKLNTNNYSSEQTLRAARNGHTYMRERRHRGKVS